MSADVFPCELCRRVFRKKQLLQWHLQKQKPCKAEFSTKTREQCLKELSKRGARPPPIPVATTTISNSHDVSSSTDSNMTAGNTNITGGSRNNVTITNHNHFNIHHNHVNTQPFGDESLAHLTDDVMTRILEKGAWVERFLTIRSVPENNNVRKAGDDHIDLCKMRYDTMTSFWKRYCMSKAIEYIVKSDIANICNELYDKHVYGKKLAHADPTLVRLIKDAWAAQCSSLDELIDKTKPDHLDVESLLNAIEHNHARHQNKS